MDITTKEGNLIFEEKHVMKLFSFVAGRTFFKFIFIVVGWISNTMEDSIYSGLSGKGMLKLLNDFAKGSISENVEAKAEIKPLTKTTKNPENISIERKYSKSAIK